MCRFQYQVVSCLGLALWWSCLCQPGGGGDAHDLFMSFYINRVRWPRSFQANEMLSPKRHPTLHPGPKVPDLDLNPSHIGPACPNLSPGKFAPKLHDVLQSTRKLKFERVCIQCIHARRCKMIRSLDSQLLMIL